MAASRPLGTYPTPTTHSDLAANILVLLDDPLSAHAEDYRRIRTQLQARWRSPAIFSPA